MTKKLTKTIFGIFFAVLSVFLTRFLFQFGVFQSLDRNVYDEMLVSREGRPYKNNIVIVKVDDYTLKEFQYPISRDIWGQVLSVISRNGAIVIGVDRIFSTIGQDRIALEQNRKFIAYHKSIHNVYYAIKPLIPAESRSGRQQHVDKEAFQILHPFSVPMKSDEFPFPQAISVDDRPFPELLAVSTGVGHIDLFPDSIDGINRSVPFFITYAGDYYPTLGAALAFAAAKVPLNELTVQRDDGIHVVGGPFDIPLNSDGSLQIDYAGKDDVFRQISFREVFDASQKNDRETLSIFKNAVVIIGQTAPSIGDNGATPFSDTSPHCYIHANVYNQLMMGQFITTIPIEAHITILLLVALIISLIAVLMKARWSVPLSLVLVAGYLWFGYSMFTASGVTYPMVEPVFIFMFCFLSSFVYTTVSGGQRKAMIHSLFDRYIDQTVIDQMIDTPNIEKFDGEEKEITAIFADIEGFTAVTEKMGPHNTVVLLNSYLTEMSRIITRGYGTVGNYVGDAMMAFWGAPLNDKENAFHACVAALTMQKAIDTMRTKWIHLGDPVINQRIGINTGNTIVGAMGSEGRRQYTAVGDTINIASRIEDFNKHYGTRVLLSHSAYVKVREKVLTREIDLVHLPGKSVPARIHELISLADEIQTDVTKKFLDHYAKGLEAYRNRAWKSAVAQFQEVLNIRPDDVVSDMYLRRSTMYVEVPPPDNWDGVFVLTK